MEKREQMKVPVEAGTIPCHQGVKDAGYLPEPEDTDAQDPIQPGHGRKPAGKAKCEATRGFRAFPHGQYEEGRRDQQEDNVTSHM